MENNYHPRIVETTSTVVSSRLGAWCRTTTTTTTRQLFMEEKTLLMAALLLGLGLGAGATLLKYIA